jgi:hypothetical protein
MVKAAADAWAFMQSTGFKNLPETINGRAAMLGETEWSGHIHESSMAHMCASCAHVVLLGMLLWKCLPTCRTAVFVCDYAHLLCHVSRIPQRALWVAWTALYPCHSVLPAGATAHTF